MGTAFKLGKITVSIPEQHRRLSFEITPVAFRDSSLYSTLISWFACLSIKPPHETSFRSSLVPYCIFRWALP